MSKSRERFVKIPDFVLKLDMNPAAKLIYGVLLWHCGSKDFCWPSEGLIEEKTGLSERTIRTMLKKLEEKGLIWIERPSGQDRLMHKNSVYHVVKRPEGVGKICRSGDAKDRKKQGGFRQNLPVGNGQTCRSNIIDESSSFEEVKEPPNPQRGDWGETSSLRDKKTTPDPMRGETKPSPRTDPESTPSPVDILDSKGEAFFDFSKKEFFTQDELDKKESPQDELDSKIEDGEDDLDKEPFTELEDGDLIGLYLEVCQLSGFLPKIDPRKITRGGTLDLKAREMYKRVGQPMSFWTEKFDIANHLNMSKFKSGFKANFYWLIGEDKKDGQPNILKVDWSWSSVLAPHIQSMHRQVWWWKWLKQQSKK